MSNKYCLITGCSEGGVGASLADAFKDNGYHVFATARSPSKVPQSLHDSANVTVLALDVTTSESIARVAETVRGRTGGELHVLVNNAGGGLDMPILDVPIDEARKLYELNFFGPVAMVQAFGPMLVKAKGCIVSGPYLDEIRTAVDILWRSTTRQLALILHFRSRVCAARRSAIEHAKLTILQACTPQVKRH
jgi:NAD(P)-dependent dehydrogenase (short-subunit alcohol dehydrogenase family)